MIAIKSQLSAFAPLSIKGCLYDLQLKTHIMGIINITPDSFSKDGLYHKTNYIDLALEQAEQMVIDGADFLDVGAESSRPGAIAVSEGEELARLLPLIKELARNVRLPISVDTYKPIVAKESLNAGASIINDIWGLQAPGDLEHQMAMIIAEAKVPVIIMHNKTNPGYGFLMKEIIDSLSRSIEIACQSGIDLGKIIVDPGIGFAKSYQDNLYILQNLDQLKILGRPILLGASRKSVVGLTLDLPVKERLEGTIATSIWGIAKGANILRVHDILAHSRAVKMCDAIKNR